jgi:hypothetical protein
MTQILITNNGVHSPEKWAMMSAQNIFNIQSTVQEDKLIEAQKFQILLAEQLQTHYNDAQIEERTALTNDAEHVLKAFAVSSYVEKMLQAVISIAKGTLWEAHFAITSVQNAVREVLQDHLFTVHHIERLSHADKNPTCPHATQYKAFFHHSS